MLQPSQPRPPPPSQSPHTPRDTSRPQLERCVGVNVVLTPLLGESVRQSHQPQLGCAIVRLAKVTINPGYGACEDNPTEVLFPHVRPGGPGGEEGAPEVSGVHRVPVLLRYPGESFIS